MSAHNFTGPYKLEVRLEAPDEVIEWEILRGSISYTNISGVPFPGANTGYNVKWAEIASALNVYDPTNVGVLEIEGHQSFDFVHRTPASGLTIFTLAVNNDHAVDGMLVEYYLEDGRRITPGQLVFGLRVKSRGEVLQEKLIASLEKSAKTQDRLTGVEIFLGLMAIVIAIIGVLIIL
jgi:hypothetical protein